MNRREHIKEMLLGAAVGLAIAGTYWFGVWGASAHEAVNAAGQPMGWSYPWACCSNLDCRSLPDGAVKETPQGYVIPGTGEVVGYQDKRVKDSPDGQTHWCAHQAGLDAGHTICLFVPPKGF